MTTDRFTPEGILITAPLDIGIYEPEKFRFKD